MKVLLELTSETLAGVRAELEAFLAPTAAGSTASTSTPASSGDSIPLNISPPNATTVENAPALSAADIALGWAVEAPPGKPASAAISPLTRNNGSTRSAADIALGLDAEDDAGDSDEEDTGAIEELDDNEIENQLEDVEPVEEAVSPPSDAETLLADKAQLNFDFDRVLALQGRAAALGIVRGVLPRGTKTKLKDIESLPVELIPAAIAALQAAEAD
jgi:hypothetical protein